MSKEFQIRDGNLIASFDLENEDGDIDFCKLLKVSKGVADEIGMFVDYVATNKIIKDQSKQIADLEAKLAEKDNTIANLSHKVSKEAQNALDNFERIKELEQQLAEKEKERQHLKEWLDDVLLSSIDNESFNAMQEEYEKEIEELKQQLTEKEKENQELKADLFVERLDKEYDNILAIQNCEKDKIDFAVVELKKVKSLIIEKCRFDVEESDFAVAYEDDIDEIFNQQINELKEKK